MNSPNLFSPQAFDGISRHAVYFPAADANLFGWYHSNDTVPQRDCVAIVCAPIGYEYTHSHRSLRHLCDQLAQAGIPALRFDYHGTGDSPGGDLDTDRLARWQQDIVHAIAFAKSASHRSTSCVIGVRMGGMLAALASATTAIDYLVLWSPLVNGKRYVRELKAIAMTTVDNANADSDEFVEGGGFLITAQTEAALKQVNLFDRSIIATRKVLVAQRDDLTESADLAKALTAAGVANDCVELPGYADMMARLELNIVPRDAIRRIVEWIGAEIPANRPIAVSAVRDLPLQHSHTFFDDGKALTETVCRFGADGHLFGVLTCGAQPHDKPAVILLNSGSVHHVGPGRLYVNLARHLARCGINCLRIDIEGIGDSIRRTEGRENHPYPDCAVADAVAALRYLDEKLGADAFVLLGLCSGAYTAFHTALAQPDDARIKQIISINPLTFRWVEGETLLVTQNLKQQLWNVNHYKSSMRDPRRWIKLLRGKADLGDIVRIVLQQIRKKGQTALRSLRETATMRPSTQLGEEIRQIAKSGFALSFFISSSDPGYHLLINEGGRFVERMIKSGKVSVQHFEQSDHTFSRFAPRTRLIEAIAASIAKTTRPSAPRSDTTTSPTADDISV